MLRWVARRWCPSDPRDGWLFFNSIWVLRNWKGVVVQTKPTGTVRWFDFRFVIPLFPMSIEEIYESKVFVDRSE